MKFLSSPLRVFELTTRFVLPTLLFNLKNYVIQNNVICIQMRVILSMIANVDAVIDSLRNVKNII